MTPAGRPRPGRRLRRPGARAGYLAACTLIALGILFSSWPRVAAQAGAAEWIDVDYAALLDLRQLSHSGESVGVLLDKLAGRPAPATPAGASADALAHSLLEPLVEPYAFALADALDHAGPATDRPLVDVGALWQPGEAQPAWVELARARRFLIESDGAGRMRIAVPTRRPGPPTSRAPEPPAAEVAREAFDEAWPVLRHAVAAERRRLGKPLEVEVHAFRHAPERSLFRLGLSPYRVTLDDTRPSGRRPPPDLAAWRAFLDSGLRLEGARLGADGNVTLIGSPVAERPTILGRPLTLADFAVAYRAVVRGGLAEPYMSLDRGYSPQTSVVNYGGRLRDTALGMVSLLCDIRFKTFSLGIDIVDGTDLRDALRRTLPSFRTHMERFAEHPDSLTVTSQQTRLWFYPDRVDLTVSPQADALLLRNVRMSAASERVDATSGAAAGEDPPWTQATVAAIDQDYDRLSAFFPELADLDEVVRLLSLFTWLEQAGRRGLLTPDLDALLALELPALYTPRTYPQLLAFNALPDPGPGKTAEVFDRVPVAEALERLNPAGRPLSARQRFERAFAALDRRDGDVQRLLADVGNVDPATLDDTTLDFFAHRAERLRMHLTVLATLGGEPAQRVTRRQQAGEQLRIFSVAIGGLDLGMGQALDRAGGQSVGLAGGAASAPAAAATQAGTEVREAWRTDRASLPPTELPAHGIGAPASGVQQASVGRDAATEQTWTHWLTGADSPDVVSRKAYRDSAGKLARIERVEGGRAWSYRFEASGSGLRAVRDDPAPAVLPPGDPGLVPAGLVTLAVGPPTDGGAAPAVSPKLGVRLVANVGGTARNLDADFPRGLLQRAVVGRVADLAPGAPLPALGALPSSLGTVEAVMTLTGRSQREVPWDRPAPSLAGEEDPVRLARALGVWWATDPTGAKPYRAVVGTDPDRSPGRWDVAPRVHGKALLVLPADAFPGRSSSYRDRVAGAWPAAQRADTLPATLDVDLVVIVSAEAPGVFARRLAKLATDPALQGKLLAAWSLAGPVRADVPARLLAAGNLAGLGLAESSVVDLRRVAEDLSALSRSLQEAGPRRVEQLDGPFLWLF